MSREKDRREASIEYTMQTKPRAIGGDTFADLTREMNVNPSFIAGAEWADKTMLDKVCEWLKDNIENYYYLDEAYEQVISSERLVEDLAKAMEE